MTDGTSRMWTELQRRTKRHDLTLSHTIVYPFYYKRPVGLTERKIMYKKMYTMMYRWMWAGMRKSLHNRRNYTYSIPIRHHSGTMCQ